jgi:hypothetical protein
MYILILTIASSFGNLPVAISSVPGFQTEQACVSAANTWLQQMRSAEITRASAICAKA